MSIHKLTADACRRSSSTARWPPRKLLRLTGRFTTPTWRSHSKAGTTLDAANVRRALCRVVTAAGLDPTEWTPRELRHSFGSLLSSSGMPIEDIAHLVGHANTRVTELVSRKELRPVLTRGASAMDTLFPDV